MQESYSSQDQCHPLYAIDRENIDRLLSKESPANEDLVDLARLLIRYEGFQGATDLKADMDKTLRLWGLSRDSLNLKVRGLWNIGFRPGGENSDEIGSGFDTSDDEKK